MRRRTLLATGGVLVGAATTGVVSDPTGNDRLLAAARDPGDGGEASTTTERLLADTDHETTLYAIDAPSDGPTAMIFGGVHGDERSGIDVAHEVTEWYPDAGTLVVVPETDRVAVENDEREGVDGDLNRHFPADEEPRSALARGVWDAVERHDPDVVLDLHRSLGILGLHQEYVGQAVFHSPGADGEALADRLDDDAVPWYLPFHRFTSLESNASGPLLFQHAARELGADGYLFETTEFLLDRETKVEMTRLATAHVLSLHGLLEAGESA
ncbi:succinylglutamate desuccinylase/aspartoacylase family protein [Natronolimnohabitans innermongolicus]|uniref:Deacylase-like protein n=1 Tax=Natronolimnohabitans innermongolicus JCM 12255 TaxID=1227499 RepID=L9X764_9EURY|nr:succinylglutamate desuccinylase/aspartoacylase family protein [Natronolimnohabitans innermongolicus]ELY57442.1 deacylase-like protein [Natronolimnohabitans innermongolicus JCM 12255]